MNEVLFEHRFWLQILGDHVRFILESLAPKEHQEIQQSGRNGNAFIPKVPAGDRGIKINGRSTGNYISSHG